MTKAPAKKVTKKSLSAPVYGMDGKKTGTVTLDAALFGIEVKPQLITRAVVAQRAANRTVLAHTKTRSERRGGGRKPWRQKGTGRARQGSIRSPQWKKGGITFGPRSNRNFDLKVNRKERRKAIAGALSALASEEGVLVIDKVELSAIKTKPLAQLFGKLPITRKALLVIPEHNENIERSARNIARVKTQLASNLNVLDLLAHKHLVIDKSALEVITKTYGGKD